MEYFQCKSEWEDLESNKTQGIILRSKAKWAEDGEKNTKFFLNLEKRNYNRKYIKKLKTRNNTELTNPNEILKEEHNYYQNFYTSKVNSLENYSTYFLSNDSIPKLTEVETQICEASLKFLQIFLG